MFQKIKRFIDKYGLIKKNDRLLVGLSGGPDSIFLLKTLLKFKNLYKLSVFACHIDHQYRRESYKDAQFVKNFCKNLKIPVEIRKIKLKIFTEENARNARYRIFKKCSAKLKCSKIATGHTVDDNAETVLMWLARGCGLNGLKGIPPKRAEIIRPLLAVSKNEITGYLKKNNVKYCVDRTNFTRRFTRNNIRMGILPLLEKVNPKAKQHIFELSEKIRRKMDSCPTTRLSYHLSANQKVGSSSQRQLVGLHTKSVSGDTKAGGGVDTSSEKYYNKKLSYPLRSRGCEASPFPKEHMVAFDACKLSVKELKIRRWKPGDKIVPFGMTGSKKVQDIFTDEKIPKNIRTKVPIVTAAGKIIWIAGVKRSNDAKITDDTKKVIKLSLRNSRF